MTVNGEDERTLRVELRVRSSDGPEALDAAQGAVADLLRRQVLQDALLERLDKADVAAEILSVSCSVGEAPCATTEPELHPVSSSAPPPDWEQLRYDAEEPESDRREIMASFAADPRVKVLPYRAEVEVVEAGQRRHPGDVLWTFRVLVQRGADSRPADSSSSPETAWERGWRAGLASARAALDDALTGGRTGHMDSALERLLRLVAEARRTRALPERSVLEQALARAGATIRRRGWHADVPSLGLAARFDEDERLVELRRLPDPMELTLGEAQALAEWAGPGARGGDLFEAALHVARRLRRTCSEVFSESDRG